MVKDGEELGAAWLWNGKKRPVKRAQPRDGKNVTIDHSSWDSAEFGRL